MKTIYIPFILCLVGMICSNNIVSGIDTEVAEQFKAMNVRQHIHESWAGKSANQSSNVWADFTGFTPYQLTSGDGVFGNETKLIGTDDIPFAGNDSCFCINSMLIVAASEITPMRIRFLWSETSFAQALSDSNFTEIMIQTDIDGDKTAERYDLSINRLFDNIKVWAQLACQEDEATMDFFIGISEYKNGD